MGGANNSMVVEMVPLSSVGGRWHSPSPNWQESHTTYISLTLPKTNIFAPTNGWLEYDPFLLGFALFSGAKMTLVSGRGKSPLPPSWGVMKNATYRSHRT